MSIKDGGQWECEMRLENQHFDYPEVVFGVTEIKKYSSVKYEYNPTFDLIEFDRVLSNSMVYPGNYGFIPNTLAEDGDPVDFIMLESDPTLHPKTLIELKILGYLEMIDDGEKDYKIIATHQQGSMEDIDDVKQEDLDKIKDFFENYKNLDNKKVSIGKWRNKGAAKKYLTKRCIHQKDEHEHFSEWTPLKNKRSN